MGAETNAFEPRGVPAPTMLADARVELHWAAQIVAAVGPESQTSLEWLKAERSLVGGATPGGQRLGLRPADLTLVLHEPQDRNGGPRRELPLAGRTLDEARRWAAEALGAVATVVPSYEMPQHPVAHRGTFTGGDRAALAELERWYASADWSLREVRRTPSYALGNSSPVRCWPHHFDIATLIELPPTGASVATQTIGVGLSPGDGSYAEPYFYVTPWPRPANPDDPRLPALPVLPGGAAWHRTGWFGAVLTATAIFADANGSPSTRAELVSQFLRVAAGAAGTLLGFAL